MRVIRVEDEPEYGVALGSILVSLLEPAEGKAKEFNRWYERDHFYAGCMSGETFFSGRRFVATRSLKDLRYPKTSKIVEDASKGSFLALYWMERGHHTEAEAWAVERVLWLGENGRMMPGRSAVHASFYAHRYAACRDADGIPPEVALDHLFAGVVMVLSERPEGVTAEERERWMLETHLPNVFARVRVRLRIRNCALPLARSASAPGGLARLFAAAFGFRSSAFRSLFRRACSLGELEFDFAGFGASMRDAGMGEIGFASGFIPTIPGTDRYVDEI